MKRILPLIVLAAVAIASMLSCQQEPAEIRVSSISFTESKVELTVGEQLPLEVKISPDNATNKKIRWSSSQESIASGTTTTGTAAFPFVPSQNKGGSAVRCSEASNCGDARRQPCISAFLHPCIYPHLRDYNI